MSEIAEPYWYKASQGDKSSAKGYASLNFLANEIKYFYAPIMAAIALMTGEPDGDIYSVANFMSKDLVLDGKPQNTAWVDESWISSKRCKACGNTYANGLGFHAESCPLARMAKEVISTFKTLNEIQELNRQEAKARRENPSLRNRVNANLQKRS